MSDVTMLRVSLTNPSRGVELLEATASLFNIKVREPRADCTVFEDLFTGKPMRQFGAVLYSQHFTDPGEFRIVPRRGATKSDLAHLLQHALLACRSGRPSGSDWESGRFTKTGESYMALRLCRPLSSYEGEELAAVMEHPDLLEMEINSFLSGAVEVLEVPNV